MAFSMAILRPDSGTTFSHIQAVLIYQLNNRAAINVQ